MEEFASDCLAAHCFSSEEWICCCGAKILSEKEEEKD
tara:strand:+ start:908 stop:1018 length:111 start_codon:yes stop_codon:yes gene_type:complete